MEELVINSPAGDIEKATAIRAAMIRREHELVEIGGALLASIDAECDLKTVGARVKDFGAAVEELRDTCKRAIKAELEASGLAVIIKQADDRLMTFSTKADPNATYVKLSALLKDCKTALDNEKKNRQPPDETFAFGVEMVGTYAEYKRLVAWLDKAGFRYASRRMEPKDAAKLEKLIGG